MILETPFPSRHIMMGEVLTIVDMVNVGHFHCLRHQRAVNIVRWSPDGQLLASGDDESIIIIWKVIVTLLLTFLSTLVVP